MASIKMTLDVEDVKGWLEKADMVSVVRCRDCKYGTQDDFGGWFCVGLYCTVGDKDGSGFCADGERREDADKE